MSSLIVLHHVVIVNDALMTVSAVEPRHNLAAMIDFRADGGWRFRWSRYRRSVH